MKTEEIAEADIEELAVWFHATNKRLNSPEAKPWGEIPAKSRADYRSVAKALLENPPLVLRRRLRDLEG